MPKLVRCSPALAGWACEEKALLALSGNVRLARDFGEVVPHSLLLSIPVGSSGIKTEAAQGSRPLPSFPDTSSASANPLMKREQGTLRYA